MHNIHTHQEVEAKHHPQHPLAYLKREEWVGGLKSCVVMAGWLCTIICPQNIHYSLRLTINNLVFVKR